MVKKITNIMNLTKYLTRSLQDEDLELSLFLVEFLDILVDSGFCKRAVLINDDKTRLFQSTNIEEPEINLIGTGFSTYGIDDWGALFVDLNEGQENEKLANDLSTALSLFIKSAEQKEKNRIISNLSSEVRRTLKPEIALEKIYNSLKEFAGLDDFYFFKKLVNIDDTDETIFKGFNMIFHNGQSGGIEESKILQQDEIKGLGYIRKGSYPQIFQSKIRGREWGLMVVTRDAPWSDDLIETFELFSEQMATVFDQHELHLESLTMAQREFLLNQITTKIRESLQVDNIIETAVQEIAQVMGVESCGLIILNRQIRGSLGHSTWSVQEEFNPKMNEVLYSLLKTDLEPKWTEPSQSIVDFSISNDSQIQEISEKSGLSSLMTCGLFQDDSKELVGILAVGFFNHVRNWSHDEQQLLEGVAKQLEIALLQASIYQESQQTKRQMALLHRLSSDIRDSLDMSKVLGQIAKGIGEVLGLNRCFVRRVSAKNNILRTEQEYCSADYGEAADIIFDFEKDWIKSLGNKSSSDLALEILHIPSITSQLETARPEAQKIAELIELKSYLSIPLVARGKILGTITVHQCDRERSFLAEEIEFIFRVGSEAAIALEHASLFDTINTFNKTDPDTGLYNKKYFREVAQKQIAKSEKEEKEISFMLIDVDFLKEINDDPKHGGHEAGDEAIQILAQVLANTVRQTPVDEMNTRIADVVGRFGGDEFMILLPNTSIENAIRVAERIDQNLKKVKHSTWPKPLSCSVGISGAPKDGYDYEVLKTQADKALYLSKEKGRNTISSSLEMNQ